MPNKRIESLPPVARLANSSAVCSRLIRSVRFQMRSLTVLLVCLFSAPALGWVCGMGSPEEEFKVASAVFMASVISNEVVTNPGGKYRRVQLRVIERYKTDGRRLDEVILDSSSNCSTVLKLDVTYIIFGFRYDNGDLAADMYSSTTPLYWDGECPSAERECLAVDKEAAALLSYLRRKSGK
jgi:hypothetical protein